MVDEKKWYQKLKFAPFKKLFTAIKSSCTTDDKLSSTRIIAYIITGLIVILTLYFLGAGMYIVIWGGKAAIPGELLVVFGALLTHQLTLLGINKHNETKQKIAEIKPIEEEVV